MKDNINRLLEAVEHPERFSDEEIEMLFNDPEARELYDTMARSANLLTETKEPDLDKEWTRFMTEHQKKKFVKIGFFQNRYAAAIAAVIVSFAVVAATMGITNSLKKSDTTENVITKQSSSIELPSNVEGLEQQMSKEISPAPGIKVFKNQTLENLIAVISDYYGVSATIKTQDTKNLRLYFKWDQAQSLSEVVDQLNNFEQIEIILDDNLLTIE